MSTHEIAERVLLSEIWGFGNKDSADPHARLHNVLVKHGYKTKDGHNYKNKEGHRATLNHNSILDDEKGQRKIMMGVPSVSGSTSGKRFTDDKELDRHFATYKDRVKNFKLPDDFGATSKKQYIPNFMRAKANPINSPQAPQKDPEPAAKSAKKPGRPAAKKPGLFRRMAGAVAGEVLKDTGLVGKSIQKKISGGTIREDAPTNSVCHGGVEGLGGSTGEPGVKKKKDTLLKYKVFRRTNSAEQGQK